MVHSEQSKDTISVLLVEDDEGARKLVRKALQSQNDFVSYSIEEVESLAHAGKSLSTRSFDNILLDLDLPDSRGIETLQSIRRVNKDIPVVVLSGAGDYQTAMDAIRYGADHFIVKSETLHEILGRSICYSIQRQHTRAMSQNNDHLMRHIELLKSQIREIKEALSEQVTCRNLAEQSMAMLSEEYGTLLDSVPGMIWHVDMNGNVVRLNTKAAGLIGKKTFEITGDNYYELFSADCKGLRSCFEKVLSTEKAQTGIYGIFKTSTSEMKTALTDVMPYHEKDGQVTGIIVYAREFSNENTLEAEISKTQAPVSAAPADPTEVFDKKRSGRKLLENAPLSGETPEGSYFGKILILDEDSLNRVLINANFRNMNIQVSFAKNARQAIEMLKTTKFDLIMSCLQMPEMSGFEFVSRIKEMKIQTPTIAMTTDFRAETIEKCCEAGFDGQIFKPINKKDLFDILDEYMQPISAK